MADGRRILKKDRKGSVGKAGSKKLFQDDGQYDIDEFHRVFIEEEDMTEYKPAMKLIGSWQEWCRIKRDWPGFNDYITLWKEELEVKLQSKAIAKILSLQESESDAQALSASKFVSEAGWNKRAGAGRPSNSEKKRIEKELSNAAQITKEEKERVFKVINFDRNS